MVVPLFWVKTGGAGNGGAHLLSIVVSVFKMMICGGRHDGAVLPSILDTWWWAFNVGMGDGVWYVCRLACAVWCELLFYQVLGRAMELGLTLQHWRHSLILACGGGAPVRCLAPTNRPR